MPGETKAEQTRAKLNDWFNKKISYVEINVLAIDNLNVRLYRNGFNSENDELKVILESGVVFYSRARLPLQKHSKQKRICDLSAATKLDKRVNSHLGSIAAQQAIHQNGRNIHASKPMPTLGEYLPEYQNLIYLSNPKTAASKTNLIEHHFSNLLSLPINEISKSHLLKWLRFHTVKLTSKQLSSGMSPYDLAESTIKGAMSTLRAAIRAASEDPRHPFVFDEELLCKPLKVQVNNTEDKYYTDNELSEIYQELAARDKQKLKGKTVGSVYADYFTPLALLCFHTGLRPSYALQIMKSDINFADKKLKIRATVGKIKKDQYIEITPEIEAILKEWLKHSCHQTTATQWLFPSPRSKGAHITSYKKTKASFIKRLSFAHLDFRIIRHTFATRHTKQTNNIRKTQIALGHKSSQTTERYSHVIQDDHCNDMDDYSESLNHIMPAKAQGCSVHT
ncbi:tyrosine-type recombinase/integrase [Shewanella sp. 0m-8]